MKALYSDLLLLLTAVIWGFAFVAQREGMQSLDPLLFNGIRFALGALVVGIFAFRTCFLSGGGSFPFLPGIVLFLAASLQQVGIVWTTAGNAGFITGLYVVFVPLLGIYRKQKVGWSVSLSVLLAVAGLYLISVKHGLSFNPGDFLVLLSAVFFAWHVQLIDIYTRRTETFRLAFGQFALCALASLICGVIYHLWQGAAYLLPVRLGLHIRAALLPLLYGGVMSVGIAYTLQVAAQKQAPPAHAALILCLEGAFALLGGWLLLHEQVTFRILAGATLMLIAMLVTLRQSFSGLARKDFPLQTEGGKED